MTDDTTSPSKQLSEQEQYALNVLCRRMILTAEALVSANTRLGRTKNELPWHLLAERYASTEVIRWQGDLDLARWVAYASVEVLYSVFGELQNRFGLDTNEQSMEVPCLN